MHNATIENQIAARLMEARDEQHAPLDRNALPNIDTLASALRISEVCMSGEAPSAWKLGGTTAATRATFNVQVPYFGPLKASEIHDENAILCKNNFIAPVVEPEILICLSKDLSPDSMIHSTEDLLAALEWVGLGLEVPDTCLGNAAEAGVNWLVADRCAAGALVVGQHMSVERLSELESHSIELIFDDVVVSSAPAGNIIGGVLSAGIAAITEFASYGITLRKNQIIATGGLCPAVGLPDYTADIRARLGSHETGFRFVI